MKTILSAFKTWTQKKIKESTADWNENDSSKSSYVKNRTHWEEQDGTVHKLDKKYLDLPTNLATTDDVESAKQEALEVANTAVANAATAQTTADSKMDTTNPVGAGSFNMNQSQVGDYAISLGYKSKATGKYSHADGYYTKTSTDYQHVGGKYNIEEVPFLKYEENNYSLSIDLGVSVYISNSYDDDQTTGTFTLKKPQQVLSENLPTNTAYFFALSNNSDTIYLYYAKETTVEVSSDKVVISNAKKTSFIQNSCKAYIVGNGMSNTKRSNAHTLDWEGNAWYSGDVYVGSTSGTNRDEGSKKLATVEEVQELASQISPQPYVAQTEAPEDKNLLWLDLDDESDDEGLADAIQAAIADVKNVAIPVPEAAKVGQTVVVKEVDGNGKPVAWEAVNLPSGGDWELLADITFEEETYECIVTEFPDGGSLDGIKRLFIEGKPVCVNDDAGNALSVGGMCLKEKPHFAGGIILCYGQSKAGSVPFFAFIERVGDYLTPSNIMMAQDNGWGAIIYKTGYNDARGGVIPFDGNLNFGTWTYGRMVCPGSTLKVWAIRDK